MKFCKLFGLTVVVFGAVAFSSARSEAGVVVSVRPWVSPFVTGHWNGYGYGFGSLNWGNYGNWGWGYPGFTLWPFYGYSYISYYPNYVPTYAAIAYSHKDDKFGQAWGYSYRHDAVVSAQHSCGSQESCAPLVWVQGGCAAAATSASQKRMGWAYSTTRDNAQVFARRACQSGGQANDCEIRSWVCSF